MGDGASNLTAVNEAVLIRASRSGCGESFGKLVQLHEQRVYNVVYRLVNQRDDAQELTQETFLRAYAKLDTFSGESRLYSWLFRIATNLALSHRRRKRVVKVEPISPNQEDGLERGMDEQAEVARRRAPAPDQAVLQQETRDRIADALSDLDDEHRPPVVLRDVGGMNYTEIADVLDLPVGTVKSRIHRGRLLLRQALKDLVRT